MAWKSADEAPDDGRQILVWLPNSVTLKSGDSWGNYHIVNYLAGDWMTSGGNVIDDDGWVWTELPGHP
jgi:hypothetical protein